MNKLKMIIINWVLKYYFKGEYVKPLTVKQQDVLIAKMANDPALAALPIFLDQCITNARNKYLYTNDPVFKGSIMAYSFLKEQLTKKKEAPITRNLTQEEKVGIMRKRGY